MTKIKLTIPGLSNELSIESTSNEPVRITVYDQDGNIVKSYECIGNDVLSIEGSDTRKHFNNTVPWNAWPKVPLQFRDKKSLLYTKSIKELGLHHNQINDDEIKNITHIRNVLNSGQIHPYVHHYTSGRLNVKLSECDFQGRNFGRLIYWVDLNPACIYLGCLLKRNDKSHDGHVSPGLGDDIAKSVLIAKEALIEELRREEEENARRNNRGR
jgi:hypothetical protein